MVAAQENALTEASEKTILFYGMVQDSSFAPDEKINVEILETGEAIQTVVGENFAVKLPEDTLWNICVTNSDTSGAEKEKCYELVYHGQDSVFSMALGGHADLLNKFEDGSVDSGDSHKDGSTAIATPPARCDTFPCNCEAKPKQHCDCFAPAGLAKTPPTLSLRGKAEATLRTQLYETLQLVAVVKLSSLKRSNPM